MATGRSESVNDLLESPEGGIDPAEFRGVLGHFAAGVAAVTGIDAGAPAGLLVNSFTSVSLTPPLVAFCVAHSSVSWPRIRRGRRHCICFLAAGQHEEARRLATSGATKFRDLAWSPSPSGLPVVDGALAWMECTVEAEYPAGDHVIVVARVRHLATADDGTHTGPLVSYRGGFGRLSPEGP
jgi:3-hydroxy-9,10-secoandrosta-1,3,5(10)-triene-9,17-dione monooxygenase reductase component